MRRFQMILALVSVTGCAFSACGTQDTAGQTASTTGTTGAGGARDCSNLTYFEGPNADAAAEVACEACVRQTCCNEFAACADQGRKCIECSIWGQPDSCKPITLATTLRSCIIKNCEGTCWARARCLDGGDMFDGGGCIPPEPDGGVTFAECTDPGTSILRGTIDGKPYEQTLPKSYRDSYNQLAPPFDMSFSLYGWDLDLEWGKLCLYPNKAPVPVTGTIEIPGEKGEREVKPCSLLWEIQDGTTNGLGYRFNLMVEGGQITGCVP